MEVAAPALRTVASRIDAAIAVSEAAARFPAPVIRGRFEVVPNGVEVERFADPGTPARGLPDGRRLLWVSRLDPQKGFPILLRAFERLASELDDLCLVVAGDGRDRIALELLSDRDRERVVMLGTVPHDDLPPLFAAANAFAAPATGHESFGVVLVEAMAAGVPVVATDIPGYREVVRDDVDGLLVPPGDAGALAGALARVLGDPQLAARLAAAGPERAAAYSWDRVVPQVEAIYERVVVRAG